MSACPNCGKEGPHFVPPSCGDAGFYLCDERIKRDGVPSNDRIKIERLIDWKQRALSAEAKVEALERELSERRDDIKIITGLNGKIERLEAELDQLRARLKDEGEKK